MFIMGEYAPGHCQRIDQEFLDNNVPIEVTQVQNSTKIMGAQFGTAM